MPNRGVCVFGHERLPIGVPCDLLRNLNEWATPCMAKVVPYLKICAAAELGVSYFGAVFVRTNTPRVRSDFAFTMSRTWRRFGERDPVFARFALAPGAFQHFGQIILRIAKAEPNRFPKRRLGRIKLTQFLEHGVESTHSE